MQKSLKCFVLRRGGKQLLGNQERRVTLKGLGPNRGNLRGYLLIVERVERRWLFWRRVLTYTSTMIATEKSAMATFWAACR